MPVINQIAEASEKFFDTVEENNAKAKKATVAFVHRVQENDLPFADRMPAMPFAERISDLPLVERMPAADKAVANGFDFAARGIEANRNLVHRMMERLGVEAPVVPVVAPAPKKTTAKKATAKKTTAKKTPAKKTTAKKTTAKKATAKK